MTTEIIIFDNDPILSTLSSELLQDAGFATQSFPDGSQAVSLIREKHPRAVLLDIMMPGLDGISICRMIKSDPDMKDTKVVMVSAKAFELEKSRAMKYGADKYISKPYDVDTFAQQIIDIVGRPANPAAGAASKSASQAVLKIWGSRSSPKSPGSAMPPTPCVSLECGSNIFIFDAGTGILPLGQEIIASGKYKDIWLFLTHSHPGHIKGLGLFPCIRDSRFKLHIAGANDPEKSLEQCVREAMESSFATDANPIAAGVQLYELKEGSYDLLPGVKLSTVYSNHPTTTLCFSLKTQEKHFGYCPDNELHGEGASAFEDSDEVLGKLFTEADILIHDAQYLDADYELNKNRGHSGVGDAVHFAIRHDVKQLLLFHTDSTYSEAQIQEMEQHARTIAQKERSNLNCLFAKEGLTLKF